MNIERNAEELVRVSSLIAMGGRTEICKIYPQLGEAKRFGHWEFFATVLPIWTAFSRIGMDVQESLRSTVESIVLEKVQAWNSQGVAAMEDLTQFVVNMSKHETEVERKQMLTPLLGGTWVVWNVTDKEPIADEAGLVSTIGEFFVTKFGAYWQVEMQ